MRLVKLNGDCSKHGEQEFYVMLHDESKVRIRWYACGCVEANCPEQGTKFLLNVADWQIGQA